MPKAAYVINILVKLIGCAKDGTDDTRKLVYAIYDEEFARGMTLQFLKDEVAFKSMSVSGPGMLTDGDAECDFVWTPDVPGLFLPVFGPMHWTAEVPSEKEDEEHVKACERGKYLLKKLKGGYSTVNASMDTEPVGAS